MRLEIMATVLLVGSACGHSTSGAVDAAGSATTDAEGSDSGHDAAMPDAGRSDLDCFYAPTRAGCGAPVITAAYLTTDCDATTGVFIVGHGFQSANTFEVNNGWLAHGPDMMSTVHTGDFWNQLTPTFMCLTTSANPNTWSGFDVTVKNPDGQVSNSVRVANDLSARPPFVSTGSSDPFDLDACLDAGMTRAEAMATFAPAASASTLGTLDLETRTRSCNATTGCLAWGAATTRAAGVTAGLALANQGATVDFTLAGIDCGALGANDYTFTYNGCTLPAQGGSYTVHVAGHCLWLTQTVRSAIAGDGSYTQTDTNGILRY